MLAECGGTSHPARMSYEVAYHFKQNGPLPNLREHDRVALIAAVVSDDGDEIPPCSEGTIVSVYREGEAYVIEFSQPPGALATVDPAGLTLIAP
jgi:hypothetical protein